MPSWMISPTDAKKLSPAAAFESIGRKHTSSFNQLMIAACLLCVPDSVRCWWVWELAWWITRFLLPPGPPRSLAMFPGHMIIVLSGSSGGRLVCKTRSAFSNCYHCVIPWSLGRSLSAVESGPDLNSSFRRTLHVIGFCRFPAPG